MDSKSDCAPRQNLPTDKKASRRHRRCEKFNFCLYLFPIKERKKKRPYHENHSRQRHSLPERGSGTFRRGALSPRKGHFGRRCPRRRRAPDPHPHAVRRGAARRFAGAPRRYGDHRIRPHRHGVVRSARNHGHDGRRMQRPGRPAMGRRRARPPLPHTRLAARRADAGRRGRGTRRVARQNLCRSVGIPRSLLRPAARGAGAVRIPARPTSSRSTRRSTTRRAAWPARSCSGG